MPVINPVLANDSYKLSHREQTPGVCTEIYSHVTPRFLKYLKAKFPTMPDKVIVYGLQMTIQILQERWQEGFFDLPWEQVENDTISVLHNFIGLTAEQLGHFKQLHDLGYLPLKFKGLPEGSHVDINIPVLTITNTVPEFYWLTNFLEPSILNTLFKPMTIATLSLELARLRNTYFDKTVCGDDGSFALHDFSYRGQSGHDSGAQTITGYLLYTKGTDTMSALSAAGRYYDAPMENLAGSIPALEHSTATLGIHFFKDFDLDNSHDLEAISKEYNVSLTCAKYLRSVASQVESFFAGSLPEKDFRLALGEALSLTRLIVDVYPNQTFAYVADSYDLERFLTCILPILKPVILSLNGTLVVRPDSGNPVNIVTGDKTLVPADLIGREFMKLPVNSYFQLGDRVFRKEKQPELDEGFYLPSYLLDPFIKEMPKDSKYCARILGFKAKGAVQTIAEIFGAVENKKGYKTLDPHIGVVYGDGMNYSRIEAIYENLEAKGFAANTVVLSGGAFMLANVTRDDLGFAIKASNAVVNGKSIPVYKEPATDKSKASAKGLFKVTIDETGKYVLQDNVSVEEENEGLLQTIWENGKFVNRTTFDEIKARLPL